MYMYVTNTLFQQHKRWLYTLTSIDGQSQNQIDYILCSQRWRNSKQTAKIRLGADCGSDHELLIAKFRLKLKNVGKTTGPFRYDQNQIPYDYTMEVTNRSKGLDWIVGEVAAVISFQSTLLQREQNCPSSFSPALLFSQHLSGTRKTESTRTKVVCSPLAWASKPAKNHTEPEWKQEGAWLLRDNWEKRWTLHSFLGSQQVPESWFVYKLGACWPQL